jgi:mycothiol synthase
MRHILKLYRSLEEPIPHIPHNYQFITFDPEIHADAWLELNNFIFAHHPDQGNWVMKDLENRMQEPWFDPQGFFLCVHNGKIAGFCWTKIHRDFVNQDPIGELYVIGVDPTKQVKESAKLSAQKALSTSKKRASNKRCSTLMKITNQVRVLYKTLGFN